MPHKLCLKRYTVPRIPQVMRVDRTFYMIVLGESVMNDAVAIAMFRKFVVWEEVTVHSGANH